MANSLLFTLALLSFGLCHPAVKNIHHGMFNMWANGVYISLIAASFAPHTRGKNIQIEFYLSVLNASRLCMQRGMQSYVVVTRLFPALGIRKECDGGTAWERVEVGDCPLTLPTQDVQVRPFQVVYFCFWS